MLGIEHFLSYAINRYAIFCSFRKSNVFFDNNVQSVVHFLVYKHMKKAIFSMKSGKIEAFFLE